MTRMRFRKYIQRAHSGVKKRCSKRAKLLESFSKTREALPRKSSWLMEIERRFKTIARRTLEGNDRVHLHLFSDHSAHVRIHRLASKRRQPPTFCGEVAEWLSSFLVTVLACRHTHDLSPTKHRDVERILRRHRVVMRPRDSTTLALNLGGESPAASLIRQVQNQ